MYKSSQKHGSLEVGSTISFAKTSPASEIEMSPFASVNCFSTTQPASCFQAGPLASFDQTHVSCRPGIVFSRPLPTLNARIPRGEGPQIGTPGLYDHTSITQLGVSKGGFGASNKTPVAWEKKSSKDLLVGGLFQPNMKKLGKLDQIGSFTPSMG